MLRFALTASLLCAAAPAFAQQAVGTWPAADPSSAGGSSILFIRCDHCPPAPVAAAEPEAPAVGTRMREVGGEQKIFRTDNLLGGSPVTTVTSATLLYGKAFENDSQFAEPRGRDASPVEAETPLRGEVPLVAIDRDAHTSSVADAEGVRPESFELRLN